MLEYHRIDISEGIDIDKTNASKECNIYHYWHSPVILQIHLEQTTAQVFFSDFSNIYYILKNTLKFRCSPKHRS